MSQKVNVQTTNFETDDTQMDIINEVDIYTENPHSVVKGNSSCALFVITKIGRSQLNTKSNIG